MKSIKDKQRASQLEEVLEKDLSDVHALGCPSGIQCAIRPLKHWAWGSWSQQCSCRGDRRLTPHKNVTCVFPHQPGSQDTIQHLNAGGTPSVAILISSMAADLGGTSALLQDGLERAHSQV